MNTLPKKRESGDPEVNTIPTCRELADRFRDLMKDFLKEGKELEREIEPKLVPPLKRLKLEIERLSGKLEVRTREPQSQPYDLTRRPARSILPRRARGSA